MAENDLLLEFLSRAVDAAKRAGEIIRKGFNQEKNVEHKGTVSIGLTIRKLPIVGVVYYQIMEEYVTVYWHPRKRCFLNGTPIKVSSPSELVTSLLAAESVRVDPVHWTSVEFSCGRVDLFYLDGGPWCDFYILLKMLSNFSSDTSVFKQRAPPDLVKILTSQLNLNKLLLLKDDFVKALQELQE